MARAVWQPERGTGRGAPPRKVRRADNGPGAAFLCCPGGPGRVWRQRLRREAEPGGRAVGREPLQASVAAGARWPGSGLIVGAALQARPRRCTARAVWFGNLFSDLVFRIFGRGAGAAA